jgi:hypothetical protein
MLRNEIKCEFHIMETLNPKSKSRYTSYVVQILYLTEDLISQRFFYIGWNCLQCIIKDHSNNM